MKPLVIYHAECNDGLAAAWVVKNSLRESADFVAQKHGEAPPNFAGRDIVICVDFCFKRAVMEAMRVEVVKNHGSLVVIDHHLSAEKELEGFWDLDGVEWHFDLTRSGSGLAWDTLNPLQRGKRPPIIDYVEDGDLWRFRHAETKRAVEALRAMSIGSSGDPFAPIERANAMLEDPLMRGAFLAMGEGILQYKEQMVEHAVGFAKEVRVRIPNGGEFDVLVTNVPYFLSSETGNRLAQDRPFGMTYYWDGASECYRFSLRSTEKGEDVSAIARAFGGGGHVRASGFEAKKLPWVS